MKSTRHRAIPQFWYNMKKIGIVISHDGERLRVKKPDDNPDLLNEYVKGEIVKRGKLLTQLLATPDNLDPIILQYLHEPLTEQEAEDAERVSKARGWEIEFHNFDDWNWYAFRPKRLDEKYMEGTAVALKSFMHRQGIEMDWRLITEIPVRSGVDV